jgi:hypothetical protein
MRHKPANLPSVSSHMPSLHHSHGGPALSPDETASEIDYDGSSCGTTPPTPSTPNRQSAACQEFDGDESSVFHSNPSSSGECESSRWGGC